MAPFRPQHLDTILDAVCRPVDFDQRVHQRLAALPRGFQRQFFAALLDDLRRSFQNLDASGFRQPTVAVAIERMRRRQGILYILLRCIRYR